MEKNAATLPASTSGRCSARALRSPFDNTLRIAKMQMNNTPIAIITSINEKALVGRWAAVVFTAPPTCA
jgi:hypothetical protein